jgi:phosphomannomutase
MGEENISYLFDVDGTLTFPQERMQAGHVVSFLSWMANKDVYIVAGSGIEKVERQITSSILHRVEGVFCSMANELWVINSRKELIYRNEWKPPIEVISDLCKFQMGSLYPVKKNNYLEHRTGMVNFSVAGRDSNMEERKAYFEWDKEHGERKNIAASLRNKYPNIEFKIGGEISIDIQPRGKNKSLASKYIRANIGGRMMFFGDRVCEGGNDYDIAKDITDNNDGEVFAVAGPQETMGILERLD